MALEIERKFLVNKEKWQNVFKPEGKAYEQGYIIMEPEKTIRVRMAGEEGFLTIKGKTTGISRAEYEYPIPKIEALELLEGFCNSKIKKRRYEIQYKNHVWEIDEFLDENEGLIIAEIELQSEDEKFELPEWAEKEVSEDKRYYNSQLSTHPFKTWN